MCSRSQEATITQIQFHTEFCRCMGHGSTVLCFCRYPCRMFLGVDTGGTFTDFVCFGDGRLRFHKVLSTPDDPSRAIFQGIRELGLESTAIHLVHGSTVATNAILERKGVKTLFVTQKGMEDLISIGRQTRKSLFDLCPDQQALWLERGDCFGVSARMDADGNAVTSFARDELQRLAKRAEAYDAVAVCLLFSFLNEKHEQQIAQAIPGALFKSLSYRVLAEYREYERASTTFLNTYVGPLVHSYIKRLEQGLCCERLYVMHSAGGVMSAGEAGEHAVRLVLSGPAGGLVAAQKVGEQMGISRLLTFDMGGTSTDVALLHGRPAITTEGSVAGLPVAVPMLDIHTIGAGGGSLAWLDTAGLPQVGPRSAGASPGPACYGMGGDQPTVTDANVVLGRIPANASLAGSMPLHVSAAREAVEKIAGPLGLTVEEAASGMIRIAEEHMAGALRVVSVQKGHDPKQFTLLCFGGAGGLHACSLAEQLGMNSVLFPVGSGAFSALGMLAGRRHTELSRSRRMLLHKPDTPAQINRIFTVLKQEAHARMPDLALEYEFRLDLRYEGQGFHLTLPYEKDADRQQQAFEDAHEAAYGHRLERNVELMTMRLSAFADTPTLSLPALASAQVQIQPERSSYVYGTGDVPQFARSRLSPGCAISGPALVMEETATLWLPDGWSLTVSEHGHLLLKREAGQCS